MRTRFTIIKRERADGCIDRYVAPILREAVKAAKHRKDAINRPKSFPRFIVKVDGNRHEFTRVDTLERFLNDIAPGSECEVFRNGGKGATINFDL